jgi:DNA-3-methyladenine glycosylase
MVIPRQLPHSFFNRSTLLVARDLLGQLLVKMEHDGQRTAGIIIETEAYIGMDDLACHARAGRTPRNQSMWGAPGHAYVFFTYGMHWMFNCVTEAEGFPAAVLIRALTPVEGIERMRKRRLGKPDHVLLNGPAKLCQAFKINGDHDGSDLCHPSSTVFIETQPRVDDAQVLVSPRVGLDSVPEPWKSIDWRFRVLPNHR